MRAVPAHRTDRRALRPSAPGRGGSSLACLGQRCRLFPRPVTHAPGGESRGVRPLHRRWIISRAAERMAAAKPRKAHPETRPGTMGTDTFHRIMRTARPIAAAHAERREGRRERELVEAQESEGERGQHDGKQKKRVQKSTEPLPTISGMQWGVGSEGRHAAKGSRKRGLIAVRAALTPLRPWRISAALLRAGLGLSPPPRWKKRGRSSVG